MSDPVSKIIYGYAFAKNDIIKDLTAGTPYHREGPRDGLTCNTILEVIKLIKRHETKLSGVQIIKGTINPINYGIYDTVIGSWPNGAEASSIVEIFKTLIRLNPRKTP